MNYKVNFLEKNNNHSIKVGVLGMGYVGLPLALAFAEKNIETVGFDIDQRKINLIKDGKSPINQIKSSRILNVTKTKIFRLTSDFKEVSNLDAVILCLPTPLNSKKKPDLSYVTSSLNSLLPFLKKGQLISLESTTYPGTTEEILKPFIEKKGFSIGKNFFLAYSPEREDPGNPVYNPTNIPKVIGGTTQSCKEVGIALYKNIINKLVPVSSTKSAEMTKLLENIHRSVNISLINELKPLLDKMEIDIYEVINAASTKPFGFVPYYPSIGVGGHCIPVDPFYLTWKAEKLGLKTRFIELADEINESMPLYVLEKVKLILKKIGKKISQSNILIIGIAYKKNIDDARESSSIKLIKLLLENKAQINYSDPYFKEFPETRNLKIKLENIELNNKSLNAFDITIIATDHDCFEYELIERESKLIIDTTGRLKPSNKVTRA